MKRLENLLKHQHLKSVPTVTRHPRTPADPLPGTLCLPQRTFVRPLPSTSRPCAADQLHQVKPSTVTTINTQTCRYPLTVPPACRPSIPHSCPQSRARDSTATLPPRLAQVWQPTLPSPRWYQTSMALQPSSILPVRTAPHLSTSPAPAKTPTFLL